MCKGKISNFITKRRFKISNFITKGQMVVRVIIITDKVIKMGDKLQIFIRNEAGNEHKIKQDFR